MSGAPNVRGAVHRPPSSRTGRRRDLQGFGATVDTFEATIDAFEVTADSFEAMVDLFEAKVDAIEGARVQRSGLC